MGEVFKTTLSNLPGAFMLAGSILVVLAIFGSFKSKYLSLEALSRWQRAALAGFGLLLFALAILLLSPFTRAWRGEANDDKTSVDIAGKWDLVLTTHDNKERNGKATITQGTGSRYFSITGEVENPDSTQKPLVFTTEVGLIAGTRLLFVYDTHHEAGLERGIASGALVNNEPATFFVKYNDLVGFDNNQDPRGRVEFLKR